MVDVLGAQHTRVLGGETSGRVHFLGDVTRAAYIERCVVGRGSHCTSEFLFEFEDRSKFINNTYQKRWTLI